MLFQLTSNEAVSGSSLAFGVLVTPGQEFLSPDGVGGGVHAAPKASQVAANAAVLSVHHGGV